MSGTLDTIVIGAPRSATGAAYVFVRSGGIWNEEARLSPLAALAGDAFGAAVAIDGDTVVVGASRHTLPCERRRLRLRARRRRRGPCRGFRSL